MCVVDEREERGKGSATVLGDVKQAKRLEANKEGTMREEGCVLGPYLTIRLSCVCPRKMSLVIATTRITSGTTR